MSDRLIEETTELLKERYGKSQPPRPGLDNAGNSSYLNASIQALFACEEFRVWVIAHGLAKPDLDYHKCMADLFINMAIGAEPFYSATQLRDMIASRDPRFQVDGEKDPFDFIWILLDILHENRRSDGSYVSGTPMLTNVFSGRYILYMKCSENHCWLLPQSSNILSLLVRPNQAIPLQHLIDSMGTLEVPIDNQKCPQCQRTDTTADISLDCTANYLIIHLDDTGAGSVTIQDTITVLEEQFSIVAFICYNKKIDSTHYYNCYTKIGETWYLFKDRDILVAATGAMLRPIHLRNAYMLFYRKSCVALRYDKIDAMLRVMRDKEPQPSEAVGLSNLGNTCYMNATLQAMFHCEAFRVHILSGQHSGRFHGLLKQLFHQILHTKETYLEPEEFRRTFVEAFPEFVAGLQHDAREFLGSLIEALFAEVNTVRAVEPDVEPTTSEQAWQHFLTYTQSSYLVHIFSIQNEFRNVCLTCNHSWSTFGHPWLCLLVFPVDVGGQAIDVQTCINNAALPEMVEMRCRGCNLMGYVNRFTLISRPPPILVLQLNINIPDPITFQPMKMNLNITVNEFIDVNNERYSCIACVLHVGETANCGHYTAYCKRGNNWYYFDDKNVTKEKPKKSKLKRSYLLFYERLSAK